ncbi:hypothetical protein CJ483_15585 [Bacillus sp. PK3_68]|nr:hypothetical protein CJ483_15585 [Bacillus sp. PK3_68]
MGTVFIAFIVFLALFAAWIISIGMTLLRYAGFTLCHKEESLIIRRGLLEKQQLTVPMDRIQGITILENPLRQGLGYCSVHLESAGGTAKEKDNANMVVMPMVKKEQALKMLAEIFPDYCFSVKLTPAPAQAISRYMGRACLYMALPVALATWFFWPFGLAFLAVFLPAALYGFICFKAVGWNIQGNQFTVRTRRISLQTAFMMKNRIQSLEMVNTWRQRQKKLSTIHSVTRSGIGGKKIKLIDASAVDGEKIYQWYELRKKG